MDIDTNGFKEEILRGFILSQSLEPLAIKKGCTTRHIDSSPGTKLKYFTISAVNSVFSILDMIDEVIINNGKPKTIFKYAFLAQKNSTKNRLGGKVNYAQILMLLPIIYAQTTMLIQDQNYRDTDEVLRRATELMKATTTEDVHYMQKFIEVATKQSIVHNHRIKKKKNQLFPKLEGLFSNIYDCMFANDFSHTKMATEIRGGYPDCRRIFKDLNVEAPFDLIDQSQRIYPKYHKEMVRHDIAADCIVVGFYLVIFANQDAKIFL